MPDIADLLGFAIEKNPVDFSDTFDQIIRQKAVDALDARKVEMAQAIYGTEEDAEDDQTEFVPDGDDVEFGDDGDDDGDIDLGDLDLDDIDIDLDDLNLDDEGTDEDA